MAQEKLPWVRLYTNGLPAFERADSEKLKKALTAALHYANSGQDETIEQSITDGETLMLFCMLKQGVDDSIAKHTERVESGKKGAEAKREKIKSMQADIDDYHAQYGGDEPTPSKVDFDFR